MRPLRLDIQDLLGVREAVLDFTPGVVAVVGGNGAGKSSILDALVIALFGEPSPARAVKKSELIRLGAESGEVALAFEAGEASYRISRRFRNGKGQEASLDRWNGTLWEPVASSVTDVNRTVARLLSPWSGADGEEGLTRIREAFLHSVFIPQGMVTRLIDARPADRWTVLASVLGLEQEEGLREKARELLDLAQAEEAHAEGALAALRERFEALPPEEEIRSRQEETLGLIRERETSRKALLKVLDLRKRLDALRERLEKARLDLREAQGRFSRLTDQHRLGKAWQGLVSLREKAGDVGRLRQALAEKEEAFALLQARTGEASKELEALRVRYSSSRKESKDLAPLADQAEAVRRYRETLSALSRIEAKRREFQIRLTELDSERESLDAALNVAERSELQATLGRIREEHLTAGRELASLMGRIVETLMGWLQALSEDGHVVYLDRFTGGRALELARNFRDSDLQRLVDCQGKVRERCRRYLAEGRELREALAAMPAREWSGPVPEKPQVLRERIGTVLGDIQRCRGNLESIEAELLQAKRSHECFVRQLPDRSDSFFSSVLAAHERREALRRIMDQLQEQGEKAGARFEALREKNEGLRRDLGRLEERLRGAREGLRERKEGWDVLMRLHRWSADELVQALRLGLPPLGEREIEEAQGLLEAAKIEHTRAEKDLESVIRGMPEEPPGREELEKMLDDFEQELRSLFEEKSVLREVLKTREELAHNVNRERARVAALQPAVDAARRMVRLTDGKGFIRFVSDHLLEVLLAGVNDRLADRGWSLRARQGIFEVVQEGKLRPAAGLSGGERAYLALLFLRQLSMRTGFHKILFIDEGLAMLDDGHLEEMVDLLGSIGSEAFVAVITHDPEVAACFPRRWEVHRGRVMVHEEV